MRLVSQGVEVLGEQAEVRGETVGSGSYQNIVLQSCTVNITTEPPGYWRTEDGEV